MKFGNQSLKRPIELHMPELESNILALKNEHGETSAYNKFVRKV